MYASKRDGRDRLTVYSRDLDGGSRDGDDLRADLAVAITDRQLTLHYQPVVPLRDGVEPGFQGLARWDHPTRSLLDAARFLGVAEVAGLTTEVGNELIRLACDDQRDWLGDTDGFISINLSSSQLGHPPAAQEFIDRMIAHGAATERIVIELSEASFAQSTTVLHNLDTFRAAGVRVFLDDFGVGYSSLSHLHQFPVDGIKIDSSVISPHVDESLVRLIVGVATTLDIRTVAEGVETDEQLNAVVRLGVDYAQGFLMGRPSRTPAPTRGREESGSQLG